MMDLMKNTWVVGISTGIISGLLVFYLTNWIMKKKGKEEYFKQVGLANQDVIVALKPYIAERGLPEMEIFQSLILSTARNYSVEVHDMYIISIFCEELIREIISDVYVSSEKKKEYTDSLITYKKNIDVLDFQRKEKGFTNIEYSVRFRKIITLYMSLVLSMMTMVLTIVLIVSNMDQDSFWYPFESDPLLWVPVIITVLSMLMLTISKSLDIFNRKIKKNTKVEKLKDSYEEEQINIKGPLKNKKEDEM